MPCPPRMDWSKKVDPRLERESTANRGRSPETLPSFLPGPSWLHRWASRQECPSPCRHWTNWSSCPHTPRSHTAPTTLHKEFETTATYQPLQCIRSTAHHRRMQRRPRRELIPSKTANRYAAAVARDVEQFIAVAYSEHAVRRANEPTLGETIPPLAAGSIFVRWSNPFGTFMENALAASRQKALRRLTSTHVLPRSSPSLIKPHPAAFRGGRRDLATWALAIRERSFDATKSGVESATATGAGSRALNQRGAEKLRGNRARPFDRLLQLRQRRTRHPTRHRRAHRTTDDDLSQRN